MQEGVVVRNVSVYGVETDLVAKRLSELDHAEQIGYDELTGRAGLDVLKHRNVLNAARKRLLREKQMVFEPVRGFGLRRLTNDEIAAHGMAVTRRIGLTARRGIQVVSSGDYAQMSPTGKVQQAVGMTVLNMIQHSASSSTLKKIEQGATERSSVLPLADTLALLAK